MRAKLEFESKYVTLVAILLVTCACTFAAESNEADFRRWLYRKLNLIGLINKTINLI